AARRGARGRSSRLCICRSSVRTRDRAAPARSFRHTAHRHDSKTGNDVRADPMPREFYRMNARRNVNARRSYSDNVAAETHGVSESRGFLELPPDEHRHQRPDDNEAHDPADHLAWPSAVQARIVSK